MCENEIYKPKTNPLILLFTHSFDYFISDDAMEDCGFLKFTDDTLKVSFLQTLNTMRKHRLFCDVVINASPSHSILKYNKYL